MPYISSFRSILHVTSNICVNLDTPMSLTQRYDARVSCCRARQCSSTNALLKTVTQFASYYMVQCDHRKYGVWVSSVWHTQFEFEFSHNSPENLMGSNRWIATEATPARLLGCLLSYSGITYAHTQRPCARTREPLKTRKRGWRTLIRYFQLDKGDVTYELKVNPYVEILYFTHVYDISFLSKVSARWMLRLIWQMFSAIIRLGRILS